MGAVANVKVEELDRTCPAGDAPCARAVGEQSKLFWYFTTKVAKDPDVITYEIEGSTIEEWDSGIEWWNTATLPVQMIADPKGAFRFRPLGATDRFQAGRDEEPPVTNFEKARDCIGNPGNGCLLSRACREGDAAGCESEARDYADTGGGAAEWFWTTEGTFAFTVKAKKREADGSLTTLCEAHRTFNVSRSTTDPDLQPVDLFASKALLKNFTFTDAASLHAAWHQARDNAQVFMGEDWLVFHRYLVRSFDEWRAFFGYPPLSLYDGSTPVPASDGGYTLAEPTRPRTDTGDFVPPCYGIVCAPPPWFTPAGDGSAREDDLGGRRCHYATDLDRDTFPDLVPIGQRKLSDFRDPRGLGCVINRTHHNAMHESVPGAFQLIATTPRDPLFWLFHKWASGFGGYGDAMAVTSALAQPTESVLTQWEREMALGAPGLTMAFPPRDLPVSRLPGVMVFFWEAVQGVAAGDLTVNGSPAARVEGSGAGPYVFSGYVPPAPGAVTIALASGAIRDVSGTPFPGDAWTNEIAPDRDGDDIPDVADNCHDLPNPDQRNTDQIQRASFAYHHVDDGLADDLGDACDPDDDGDTRSDADEIVAGSDPLDWRDPDPCPLDPGKTDPGECGCGSREIVDAGGVVTCAFANPVSCAVPAVPTGHEGHQPAAATPPACDDDDACTADSCIEGTGCLHAPVAGGEAAACVCRRGSIAACAGVPLPKPLVKAATRACRSIVKAVAPSTKARAAKRLTRRSMKSWQAALKLAATRKSGRKLGMDCVGALRAHYLDARGRAEALLGAQ